ncbi:hypothetical protein C8R44DRAFT_772097 [Mycena epipterygia]|nr:hypothetical protein C8R44DRAFT_772097 [Mycena epipterygia]
MAQNTAELKPTMDDRAGRDVITIWDRWQPACDTCGRLGSSVRERLIPCAWCGVAKYCSSECQKRDGEHRNRCHLVEVDRKLSEVFVKSLGPGFACHMILPTFKPLNSSIFQLNQ